MLAHYGLFGCYFHLPIQYLKTFSSMALIHTKNPSFAIISIRVHAVVFKERLIKFLLFYYLANLIQS